MNQNKDLTFETKVDDKNADDDDTKLTRTCVACGELESYEKPLGIMSSNTKASVFWKLPRHSSEVLSVGYKEWDKDSLLHTNPGDYGVGYESRDLQKLYNNEFEARVLSTCGHSIHYDCLASRTIGISQYPCPLCHNLNESFLPSYVGSLDLEVPREMLLVRQSI